MIMKTFKPQVQTPQSLTMSKMLTPKPGVAVQENPVKQAAAGSETSILK
jgi:hypothetical protein